MALSATEITDRLAQIQALIPLRDETHSERVDRMRVERRQQQDALLHDSVLREAERRRRERAMLIAGQDI